MNPQMPFRLNSIKTRVTLGALGVFIVSLWVLGFLTTRILEEDISQLVADAQASATTQMAAQLDRELGTRLSALAEIAGMVDAEMIASPPTVQRLLESQPLLQDLFNVSVLAVDRNGIGIADAPYLAERIGANYRSRVDAFAKALDEARPQIGSPIIGVSTNQPLLPLAVPVVDDAGQVIGALGGAIDLSQPNFFDDLTAEGYGQTGTYSIISKSDRIIVTSSDPDIIMYQLPPEGVSPLLDRAIAGEERTYRYVTVLNVDSLTTVKGMETTDWLIATITPAAEAFAPVKHAQRRMILVMVLVTILVGLTVWWMLRHQLRPMLSTVEALQQMTAAQKPLQTLSKIGTFEIDSLIASFNQLLNSLIRREQENKRFREIAERAVYGIAIADLDRRLVYVNLFLAEIHGYQAEDLIGRDISVFHSTEQLAEVDKTIRLLHEKGHFAPQEIWHVDHDGTSFPMLMSGVLLRDEHGEPEYLAASSVDITERKQAEEALKESETFLNVVLESMPLPVFHIDTEGRYTGVNKAFETFFGQPRSELVGRSVFDIHPPDLAEIYHAQDRELLNEIGTQSYESQAKNSRGEIRDVVFHKATLTNFSGEITGLVGALVDVTERKQADAEIHRLAYYDLLTNLPNRRLLQDRLRHAMAVARRSSSLGALVFLDIDDFKALNDTRGHDAGDQLLVKIAGRICSVARETDTIARLGGDEFVVMLEDLSADREKAAIAIRQVGEKIRLEIACPYEITGGEFHCTASLGIALFNGHEESVDTLLKQADLAMYKAKDEGRNVLRFFDPAMQTTLDERIDLERDLRLALELGQFTPFYQAQVDRDGRVRGAEVLLRWQHPERGMVSPAEFIPLAEATGLILPIGHWVLESACRQIAHWSSQQGMQHVRLAVNVSAREFRQPDFVDQVKQVLSETDADPARLRLELTESMVLEDVGGTFEKMQALKQLGIGFALDDFGTGHSSLAYLTRLPLDTLKIDSSFVFNLPDSHNDAVVAQTIISMARSLGLNVIAEGVETEAQRDFLDLNHCHVYQGYLFSRPVSLKEFEKFCAASLD